MKTIVIHGILIAVLCAVWELIMGVTGWYRDPVMMNVFYVVILMQVVVMYRGLSITAPERGYGGQVAAGILMSIVAGALIILVSLLFTTVVYPNYFEEVRQAVADGMRKQGIAEPEIASRISAMSPLQSPVANALAGFFGTVLTGIAASLIIAIFKRKKQPAAV